MIGLQVQQPDKYTILYLHRKHYSTPPFGSDDSSSSGVAQGNKVVVGSNNRINGSLLQI